MRRTMMIVGLMVALLTVSAEAKRIIRPGNDLAGFTDSTSNAPIQAVTLVDTVGNPVSLSGGAGSEVTILNESLHVYGSFSATLGDTVTVTGSVDIGDVTDTVDVTVLNDSLKTYGTATVSGTVDVADIADTVDVRLADTAEVTVTNDSLKTYGNVAVTGTVTTTVDNDSLKTYGTATVSGTVDVADIADTVDVRLADTAEVTVTNDSLKTYGNVAVTGTVTATVDNDSLKTYSRVTNDSLKTYFGAVPTVNSRIAARTDLVRGTATLANPNEETQVLAAVSGKNLDLTTLVIANSSGGPATVSVRDSLGGSVVMSLVVADQASVCFTFPIPLIQSTGTNNKWTAASDAAPCSVTMQAVKQ